MSCFTLAGNVDETYNGEYCQVAMINDQPCYANGAGRFFYYFPGYWQMDDRMQDGSNDWYHGGCMPVDDPGQYLGEYMSGEAFALHDACNNEELTMQMTDTCGGVWISDHPDFWYNGFYYQDGTWNGYPMFTDGMDAYLYYLDTEHDGSGFWQFDNRAQDGTNDWYDGGYKWCDNISDEDCLFADETGHGVNTFSGNDIDFQWDISECANDICTAFQIDHPDFWYTGYYFQDGEWNGFPHFTDGMGAHLYWKTNGESGWWQFDNREQDGTNDWYDGGYRACDAFDDCGDEEEYLATGHVTAFFNGENGGDVTFTPVACTDALVAA